MSFIKRRNVGVHPNYAKNTSGANPRVLSNIPFVKIPVAMQIGPPPKVCVAKGDKVLVGQMIAKPEAAMSVPVHASVSGEVIDIVSEVQSNGRPCDVVVIKNDKRFSPDPELKAPVIESKADFLAAVQASGLVGLGGAGFPTHIKLNPPADKKIDYLLVNGMECEPYITSDDWLMQNRAELIFRGISEVLRWCEIPQCIVGLESNTPDALKAMQKVWETRPDTDKIKIVSLPAVYPQGAEKVLITSLTGRKVPPKSLPHDVGCLVMNVASLAHIATYLETGMPLVRRLLTLDGPALNRSGLYDTPIGSSISDLLDFAGGLVKVAEKVIMGGPMMGVAVSRLDSPILKMNNAILVFDHEMADLPEEGPCIHCGRCALHCPMHLMPTMLDKYARKFDAEQLLLFDVNECIECGACTYICPAKRYLVQNIRVGKQIVRDYQAAAKAQPAKEAK